MSRKAHK